MHLKTTVRIFLFLLILSVPVILNARPENNIDLNTIDQVEEDSSAQEDEELASNPAPKESKYKFFTSDYAILRYSGEVLQLELFALVDRVYLKTRKIEEGYEAQYSITFKIYQDDSLITGDSWIRNDFSMNLEERASGQKIPELVRYLVEVGQYKVEIQILDLVGNVFQIDEILVDVESYDQEYVDISDIIFASKIEKADKNAGEFDHNGLLVLPNAERMFGQNNPQIYYYTELYNLTEGQGNTYTVDREILDETRTVVKTLDQKEKEIPASDCVEMDAFSIATLRTGGYYLVITVHDLASNKYCSRERKFWVYRPGEKSKMASGLNPGFDIVTMTQEEVEKEIDMARYIMTSNIQKQIKDLSEEGKRTFLAKFWIANDPDRSTPENELRELYLQRIRDADIKFGTINREGWSTDRGRVYLMHGEPDNIDDHPFDSQASKSYQIWYYDHLEGGVQYVFVDRNGYGDYIQVHSNKSGELSNTNWRETENMSQY